MAAVHEPSPLRSALRVLCRNTSWVVRGGAMMSAFAAMFAGLPDASAQMAVAPGRQVIGTAQRPCDVRSFRAFDNARADASGMQIENCRIVAGFVGINLHNKATVADGFILRKSSIMLKRPTEAGSVPTGVRFEWGRNILVEDVEVRGFKTAQKEGVYPNGDGLASEFAVGLTYRNVVSRDNANGGFDDKARNVRYENTVSEENDYGYRMWWRGRGNFIGTTMTCRNNRKSCLHLMNGGRRAATIGNADVVIDMLVVDNITPTPIAIMEKGTSLTVKACRITAPSAVPFMGGEGGTVHLGPTCADAQGNIVMAAPSANAH
ncbi:hypothetical protein BV96_03998 [Sphingomonas paucimobilis]|nr:hypothetical protein BV96_03998 [Sphingomonas paucimobilis]